MCPNAVGLFIFVELLIGHQQNSNQLVQARAWKEGIESTPFQSFAKKQKTNKLAQEHEALNLII